MLSECSHALKSLKLCSNLNEVLKNELDNLQIIYGGLMTDNDVVAFKNKLNYIETEYKELVDALKNELNDVQTINKDYEYYIILLHCCSFQLSKNSYQTILTA